MLKFQPFEDVATAADTVRNYIIVMQNSLPAHVRDQLVGLTRTGTSPVPLIVGFAEAVYANRDEFENDAKMIAARASEFCAANGYFESIDGKAHAMSLALRRDAGERAAAGRAWPKKDKDPPAAMAYRPKPKEE